MSEFRLGYVGINGDVILMTENHMEKELENEMASITWGFTKTRGTSNG